MLGGYIGQFLPLSGGALGGTLNLAGNDLFYVGNIKDSSGNARVQIINTGSNRAMNLLDDLGNVMLAVDETGLLLSTNGGLSPDDACFFNADGSGNCGFSGTSFTIADGSFIVDSSLSASSGVIAGSFFLPTIAVSGSATAIGTVIGGAISGTTTGKKWIASFRPNANQSSSSDVSFIDTNGNFVKASFTAAQAIYVDGINGSDTKGNGTAVGPFATPAHALSVAASGMCVVIGPGTYNITQLVCPNGVSLIGSGMDVTNLVCTSTAGGPFVIVGTGTVVSDMTINSANGHNIPPIGFQQGASSGSTQMSTLFYLRRIRATGDVDGLYVGNKAGSYASVYFECRDCIFASNYDTFQIGAVDSTAWQVNFDLINCQFLPTRKAGVSAILRCITGGASSNARLFNCLLTVTDLISSTVGALGIYAGVSLTGFGAINLELYGTTINYIIPNVASSLITSANYNSLGIAGSGSTVKIGAGNTFDPNLIGVSTTTVTYLAGSNAKSIDTLAVASSAVSPYTGPNGNQFDIGADAGSLTSNTLTINNPSATPGVGTANTTDGMETRYRIKNTNSGSTAMTLAFGGNFNVGSTTVATIAAGKRAYLTFTYDADNSKWDLTGYTNGL